MEANEQLLTVDEIFAAQDLTTVDVLIPEWPKANGEPGVVRLKTMTARESINFVNAIRTGANKNLAMVLIVKECAIDAKGNKLFTQDQVSALANRSVKVFNRLQREALLLNGFTELAEEAVKNV